MVLRDLCKKHRILASWLFFAVMAPGIALTDSYWNAFPLVSHTLFAAGCLLVGLGVLGRVWCSLYIAGYKNRTLVTEGPYSLCRNPLYFFSLLGGLGVGLATETLLAPALIALFFALYYPSVIQDEEAHLAGLYPEDFESYRRTTPSFFPKWSSLREPEEYLVQPRVFRKTLCDAFWFIALIGLVELLDALHASGIVPFYLSLF